MQRFGRYEVVRTLGQGGMGVVYEAELVGPGGYRKLVALKVLHDHTDALRREARLGGLLRHRHLVDVYEVGEADGRWFCAMELCDGGTIASCGTLAPRAVVEVGLAVCEALQYAHEELGLVHLDLKPDNLLLHEGVIKVADLGIAHTPGAPRVGRGTPGYMPPEQAQGLSIDARADVYALGVTLLELATGTRQVAVDTMDWSVADTVVVDVDRPDVERPGRIPGWLEPVVLPCLEPDAAKRPSMAALAVALRGLAPEGPGLRQILGLTVPVHSPGLSISNLAAEPNVLVGRERELEELAAALAEVSTASRLLVVKGPPGIGKSRLATTAARAWHRRTGSPAWLCDLGREHTLESFLALVAATLDVLLVRESPESQTQHLGQAIADIGPVLLVFDTFEHLTILTSALADWCRTAPQARFLVTTRVTLPAPQAAVLELEPLPTADAQALLVARALQRGVHIECGDRLAELATRLDGVPLALELAAGRLGVLTVDDVLDRLGLSLLRQSAEGRHHTLAAALDWSWSLLSHEQRSALTQLSVFAGDFSLDAADEVVQGVSVLETVGELVDRSLVGVDGDRFRLLSSVQEYASDKLGDDLTPQERHGRFFARFGTDQVLREVEACGGVRRWRSLAQEMGEVVAACRRAVERADVRVAVDTLGAAWLVMQLRGPYEGAAELAASVCALPKLLGADRGKALGVWARALDTLGRPGVRDLSIEALEAACQAGDRSLQGALQGNLGAHYFLQGEYEQARASFCQALDIGRELGERAREACALAALGSLHLRVSEFDQARAHYEEALGLHRVLGDRRQEGIVLGNLAILNRHEGRYDQAEALYRRALAIHHEMGDQRVAGNALGNLGNLMHERARHDEARTYYEEALAMHRRVGNRRVAGEVLENLGELAATQGRFEEARCHLHDALTIHREGGDRRSAAGVDDSLGDVCFAQGRIEAAITHYGEALAIHQELGNPETLGRVLGKMGNAMFAVGRTDEALSTYRRSLENAKSAGDQRQVSVVLGSMANAARIGGDLDSAHQLLVSALAISRELGTRSHTAQLLGQLGGVHLGREHPNRAREVLEAALTIGVELCAPAQEGVALAGLARVSAWSDPVAATQLLTRALALTQQSRSALAITEVHLASVEVAWRSGDLDGAHAALAKAEASSPPGWTSSATGLDRACQVLTG